MVKYVDESGLGYFKKKLFSYIYPVGSIYTTTSETDPAQMFGGTWERYARGRCIVGHYDKDTDFDTVDKFGGEKTHTLSEQEMPVHSHSYPARTTGDTDYGIGNFTVTTWQKQGQYLASNGWNARTGNTGNRGGGIGHNNMQPYIVAYIWRRTA